MSRRTLFVASCGLVAALILGTAAAASRSVIQGVAGVSHASTATQSVRIAWFGTRANAFYAAELKALQAEASKLGANVTVFDSAFDPNKQFSQVQDAITSKRYKGFIIAPVNGAALVPIVQKALAARIKVVGVNGPLGPNPDKIGVQIKGVSGQIWTPTVSRGKWMTQQMIAACRGVDPCKVAYHAGVAAFPIEQTIKRSFEAAIKNQPNIDYVGYFDGNGYTVAGGQKVAADIIAANPDINVIASGDQAALGAALAVRAAGKTPGGARGQVRLLGIGSAGVVLKAIKDGTLFNTQADAAAGEGRLSLRVLLDAIAGKLKKPAVFDPVVRSGRPAIINRGNVAKVKAEY